MRRKLASLLTATVLSACGMPAFAQAPIANALGLPPAAPAPAACAAEAPACNVDPGCDHEAGGYFTAGAGLYFLMPFNSSNSAGFYTASTKALTANVDQQNFHQHVNAAPLVWLGYTFENGWGMRARWFEFVGSQTAVANGDPASGVTNISTVLPVQSIFTLLSGGSNIPGDQLASSRNLAMNVFDFEATNNFVWNRWAVLATIGLRYAHISNTFNSDWIAPGGKTVIESYYANATFNGVGPTASLEGRRRMGESDFFLYGSGRGSLLYGSLHQNSSSAFNLGAVGAPPGFPTPTLNVTDNQQTLIGVAELEVGGEWARVIGRTRVFAQLAFVGQMWVGGSASPNGASVQEQPLSFIGLGGFGSGTSNFGFMGGVFRAGVSF